jgi:hypothetical protein
MAPITKQRNTQSGKLIMPHGRTPWHFKHGTMEGTGLNGQIRNLWRTPVDYVAMPGKGVIRIG